MPSYSEVISPAQRGPLRVLHLEDDSHDHEMIRRALDRAGAGVELTPAATREEFESALGHGDFDAVLADIALPGYSGMAALEWAQAHRPEVPFLFVSGTISTGGAIEAVKRGATDYVLKHELERLAPALDRALRESAERSKRRAAEAALKSSESFLQSLVENLPVIVYRKDAEGRLTFANQLYCERRGKTLEELLGQTDFDLSPPELAKQYWDDNRAVMEQRRVVDKIELQINPATGEPSWIHIIKVPIIGEQGEVVGTQGMYWDVTERKKAEEALRLSERRFREMAENIRDVFWVRTPDGQRVLYGSPAYEIIWGQSVDALYSSPKIWLDAIVPDDRPKVCTALEQLAQGTDYRIEYRISQPSGALRWIEDRGFAVRNAHGAVERTLGVAADITARKELEDQLRQAQKMEAIGQLAGGVAHDFNNLLTVITGHARLMLDEDTFDPERVKDSLKQIYMAGERAASLTRQLLVFSRKHRLQLQVLDLNEVIDDLGKMLRRLIGEDVAMQVTLASRRPVVQADAGMVEQILMNLVINARDAMPRGGQLLIKTEFVVVSEEEAKRQTGARAGNFVRLSVADTGTGIAPEILPRIFEPFFTTKEPGKGTGLGLATVFGIVQQHRGWVAVESQVNAGTTFTVFLPAAPRDAAVVGTGQPDTKVSGGQETILVVEDETTVRDFAVGVLQRYGYRVLQAASGVDALEVWHWHSARISVLITDLVMPENMNGLELAERLQREKPTLKVICVSGYSGDMMEQALQPKPGVQFLHKPYQPRALAKAVRDILDTKS